MICAEALSGCNMKLAKSGEKGCGGKVRQFVAAMEDKILPLKRASFTASSSSTFKKSLTENCNKFNDEYCTIF